MSAKLPIWCKRRSPNDGGLFECVVPYHTGHGQTALDMADDEEVKAVLQRAMRKQEERGACPR